MGTLLITCDFTDGVQVLIKRSATQDDVDAIRAALEHDPDTILQIGCQATPGSPEHPWMIRAGLITGLEWA